MRLIELFSALISENDITVPKSNPTSNTVQEGLQILFAISAAVAVLIIAVSSLRIVISRGNSQDVAKARDAIIYSSVGLIITMSAFAIVTFVMDNI